MIVKVQKRSLFLFHHSQIDQKKTKSIEGMKDEYKEEEEVKGSILMEA